MSEFSSKHTPEQGIVDDASANPIELQMDGSSVVLRELTPDDAESYYELVHKNADHLRQGGMDLASKYESPVDVKDAISESTNTENMHQFGVWKNDQLVGGLYLEPAQDEGSTVEISFFTDLYQTTRRIGRTAVATALRFTDERGFKVAAQVNAGHTSSSKLLVGQGFKQTGYMQFEREAQEPK